MSDKVMTILDGYNRDHSSDLGDMRMQICKDCPISRRTEDGLLCDASKFINTKTNEVSDTWKENYVRGCGCYIN